MNSAKIVMRGLGNLEDKDPPFKVQPPRIEVDLLECGDLSPLYYCCHIPEAKRRQVAALLCECQESTFAARSVFVLVLMTVFLL